MWEDDFDDEDDYDEDDEFEDVFDDCTWYVYDNMSEELENKVELEEIEKVFLYEKQFLDESNKLLEFGVQTGDEFEEDMVYYIQKKMSNELILTIEDITEILRLEEAYYIETNDYEEFFVEYYLVEAVYFHYVTKDYENAKLSYRKAFDIVEITDKIAINFIKESLEELKNPKNNEVIYYLKSIHEESNLMNYLTNYTRFFIEKNKLSLAKRYIDFLLNCSVNQEFLGIKAQVLFYCFANLHEEYPNSKSELEELIAKGVECYDCDFSFNVQKAKEHNHSEIVTVIEFAEKLTLIRTY